MKVLRKWKEKVKRKMHRESRESNKCKYSGKTEKEIGGAIQRKCSVKVEKENNNESKESKQRQEVSQKEKESRVKN